jgi:molecular chaperone HscA
LNLSRFFNNGRCIDFSIWLCLSALVITPLSILLSVAAKEMNSGVESQIEVKPSYGLSDEQITSMLQDSFHTAEIDKKARALAESRLEVDRMCLATRAALEKDAHLLAEAELQSIQQLMALAQESKSLNDAIAIEQATEALAKGTEAFAALRMNESIRQALSGKTIESL